METKKIILPTQIGVSVSADFSENEWTFEMQNEYTVTLGQKFAIVPLETWQQKLSEHEGMRAAIERMRKALIDCESYFDTESLLKGESHPSFELWKICNEALKSIASEAIK